MDGKLTFQANAIKIRERLVEQIKPGFSDDNDALIGALGILIDCGRGETPIHVTQRNREPYTSELTLNFLGDQLTGELFFGAYKAFQKALTEGATWAISQQERSDVALSESSDTQRQPQIRETR